MMNPWINKYQNWNPFYSPNISRSLKIQKIFCCMRCDTRTRVFNFWNFRCRKRSKKGLLAALTFESSKNFILTYFQKLMWFYWLATKDSLLGRVWGKTFCWCEIPWTALTEIASWLSVFQKPTVVVKKIERLYYQYFPEYDAAAH